MIEILAQAGGWRVAVTEGGNWRTFDPQTSLELDLPSSPPLINGEPKILNVEVVMGGGGIQPRAVIGAKYSPGGSGLRVQVGFSGPITSGADTSIVSRFSRSFVEGLPSEFEPAVRAGIIWGLGSPNRLSGTLMVLSGGYDEQDSSAAAFERAARLLAWTATLKRGLREVNSQTVASAIEDW